MPPKPRTSVAAVPTGLKQQQQPRASRAASNAAPSNAAPPPAAAAAPSDPQLAQSNGPTAVESADAPAVVTPATPAAGADAPPAAPLQAAGAAAGQPQGTAEPPKSEHAAASLSPQGERETVTAQHHEAGASHPAAPQATGPAAGAAAPALTSAADASPPVASAIPPAATHAPQPATVTAAEQPKAPPKEDVTPTTDQPSAVAGKPTTTPHTSGHSASPAPTAAAQPAVNATPKEGSAPQTVFVSPVPAAMAPSPGANKSIHSPPPFTFRMFMDIVELESLKSTDGASNASSGDAGGAATVSPGRKRYPALYLVADLTSQGGTHTTLSSGSTPSKSAVHGANADHNAEAARVVQAPPQSSAAPASAQQQAAPPFDEERAAVIIQAAHRGFAVRKQNRRQQPAPQAEPSGDGSPQQSTTTSPSKAALLTPRQPAHGYETHLVYRRRYDATGLEGTLTRTQGTAQSSDDRTAAVTLHGDAPSATAIEKSQPLAPKPPHPTHLSAPHVLPGISRHKPVRVEDPIVQALEEKIRQRRAKERARQEEAKIKQDAMREAYSKRQTEIEEEKERQRQEAARVAKEAAERRAEQLREIEQLRQERLSKMLKADMDVITGKKNIVDALHERYAAEQAKIEHERRQVLKQRHDAFVATRGEEFYRQLQEHERRVTEERSARKQQQEHALIEQKQQRGSSPPIVSRSKQSKAHRRVLQEEKKILPSQEKAQEVRARIDERKRFSEGVRHHKMPHMPEAERERKYGRRPSQRELVAEVFHEIAERRSRRSSVAREDGAKPNNSESDGQQPQTKEPTSATRSHARGDGAGRNPRRDEHSAPAEGQTRASGAEDTTHEMHPLPDVEDELPQAAPVGA